MRRTNRVEPVSIDVRSLAHAVIITTTELEIIRQVKITPIIESIANRTRCPSAAAAATRSSRKSLWCIGCLFLTAGILAFSIVIAGLTIVFGKMKATKKSNIERYDLGDLHYGINNINHPSNIYLSNINKVFIKNYLSNQLLTEPGYRGLIFDEILFQNKLHANKQKQRDTTCSVVLIIQNTQVYFDHCPTCTSQRNSLLRRLFFNRTAFREPFYLLLNSQYLFVQICSTPNASHLIAPVRLDQSDIEKTSTHRQSAPPQLDFTIPNDITADVSTMRSIETTSFENFASFTTDHSSAITSPASTQTPEISSVSSLDPQSSSYTTESSTSFRKTTASMFQFLPFRPPPTISSSQSNRQRTNPHRYN